MGLMYRLMYRVGFAPWDRITPPELAEVVTGPDALKPGRALDLGSGLGTKAVFIASHGWRVTGVESVPRAVEEARRRASKAGVEIDFRRGDVTRLQELGLEPGYDLVFDFGCFHGLNGGQRDAYARGVNALTGPGSRLLIMAFTQPVPPVTSGVSSAELAARFGPDWNLASTHRAPAEGGTTATRRGAAAWFRLERS